MFFWLNTATSSGSIASSLLAMVGYGAADGQRSFGASTPVTSQATALSSSDALSKSISKDNKYGEMEGPIMNDVFVEDSSQSEVKARPSIGATVAYQERSIMSSDVAQESISPEAAIHPILQHSATSEEAMDAMDYELTERTVNLNYDADSDVDEPFFQDDYALCFRQLDFINNFEEKLLGYRNWRFAIARDQANCIISLPGPIPTPSMKGKLYPYVERRRKEGKPSIQKLKWWQSLDLETCGIRAEQVLFTEGEEVLMNSLTLSQYRCEPTGMRTSLTYEEKTINRKRENSATPFLSRSSTFSWADDVIEEAEED